MTESQSSNPIVLFDGICNLCNTSVRFLLAYNKKANLLFCPLQSAMANKILDDLNWKGERLNSLIFIEEEQIYTKSEAVFRISTHLIYPWKAIYHFRHLPKGFCDWIYDKIAQNRYAWFGKKSSCMIPKPDWKNRFL
ncbi:putative DCC family thiol-disulfide oxidoreductase YuxK [Ancylomarina subtilis]|uniref:Putative DCC family thiol-disulfide oxidoreductase YuxK n=1 Tax=Ancylomarina subtilis TaxID=1639035 RepID=A0A4Q7VKD8_9BACT|nr:DCC1-like thiol-disulfide oxidoreductase family protein [Ancylomarina subtilis]RZT96711.1 putative DCC family thiol-disulfide oxidoreductase YuxK [Ancylomarina subtilis]